LGKKRKRVSSEHYRYVICFPVCNLLPQNDFAQSEAPVDEFTITVIDYLVTLDFINFHKLFILYLINSKGIILKSLVVFLLLPCDLL